MRAVLALATMAWLITIPADASAHCQIPCGIYDDHARMDGMTEDAATIKKAVVQLQASASKTDAQSLNQRVRWTQAKDDHASRIIEVVSEYFLTQKIKPADASDKKAYSDYIARLTACHEVMRAAMKTKQTVDPGAVEALDEALEHLGALYPSG